MMAEEEHELEGKEPCAQRPTLKIKSKIQSLECRARVSQKSMSSRASRINPRAFEGKAPCAQRPTLKIKSKILSLECRAQARVSQKSMRRRQQDQSSRISNLGASFFGCFQPCWFFQMPLPSFCFIGAFYVAWVLFYVGFFSVGTFFFIFFESGMDKHTDAEHNAFSQNKIAK
jgi:hypothetical protein